MDDFEKFYNKALRFLSYRPRSEKEIKDKLKSKKVDLSIVEQIVQKLKEQNFIDDEEFARWWIEQRTTFKPRSIKLIKIELKQKGIDDEIISNFKFQISNDLEQARKLVQKRIQKYKKLPKEEIYQKLGQFLARRGFDWETAKKVIDETLKEVV